MDIGLLAEEAIAAKERAYAPYSHFRVGAALLAKSGKIYRGCNIENAAYSPTNCAERTAFFKAVSEGEREFEAIAITGDADDYVYPCGVCRQVMAEFCDGSRFRIILVNTKEDYRIFRLNELLPGAFTGADLKKPAKLIRDPMTNANSGTGDIIWREDLTHDGIPEQIKVRIRSGSSGEMGTVAVYAEKPDGTFPRIPIWREQADTVQAGWNGIYLYRNPDDGRSYLLVWQPAMYQSRAQYHYRVFSLSAGGEEKILEGAQLSYDLNDIKPEDEEKARVYLNHVNELLKKSYVLVDTDGGEVFYSAPGAPVTREADVSRILSQIRLAQRK